MRLLLLGPVQMAQEEQLVSDLPLGKPLALLGYLIALRKPLPREHLADLFWQDLPASRGRANLSWMLHKLTTMLPHCLESNRHSVRFRRPDACWIDIDAFQALTGQGDTQSLAEAAALYRGAFLEGLSLEGCADFELWLVAERERWRQRTEHALNALIAHHVETAACEDALRYAERLLALAPWREDTHRGVMRLLAEQGQRGAALAQYKACCRGLEVELGVAPSPETVALYKQICDDAIPLVLPSVAPATRRHNLPAQTTPFIGRGTQLAEVRGRLVDPAVRLLTLTGVGGTGKTRLALEVAAGLLDVFHDGVFFVPLAPIRDPALVIPTIAAALGVRESGDRSLIEALETALRDKRRLLLVDNFEHVLEAGPLLSALMTAAPQLKVLATSRAPLHVYGEHEYVVPPMDLPDPRSLPSLERLGRAEAVSLFVQGARRVRPGFALGEDNAPAVAEVCARLDGLPLAIELASSRVKLFSPRAMLIRLGHTGGRLRFLTGGPRDLPARQRTLRATIEWSYGLMDTDERALFRRISVFSGGCTCEAVAAVCADPPVDADGRAPVTDTLASLVDHNLLQTSKAGDETRITMLETIREFALERLTESGEESAVRELHAAYYTAAMQDWTADLKGPRQLDALREIEDDLGNARAAWEWVTERGQVERLDQAVEGLCLFYEWHGRYQQGEAACRRAAERLQTPLAGPRATSGSAPGEVVDRVRVLARVSAWQGYFSTVLGGTERAGRCFDQSMALLNGPELGGLDVLRERAFALFRLSQSAAYVGDNATSRQLDERSLSIYRGLGDSWWAVRVLWHKAMVAWRFADYEHAAKMYEEGLSLARALGDHAGMAMSLNGLAGPAGSRGDLERAERWAREALTLSAQIGQGELIVNAHFGLSLVLHYMGRYPAARQAVSDMLTVCRERGHRRREISALTNLSMADRHLGRYGDARAWAQAALALSHEVNQPDDVGTSCMELGRTALAEGAYDEAYGWLQQSLPAYDETGRAAISSQAHAAAASVARALERPTEARQYLRVALRMTSTGYQITALLSLPTAALLSLHGATESRQSSVERAVELYALASRYPYVNNSRWFEDVAGREITAAAETLPPDLRAAAQERGRARDLWATVEELLGELQTSFT